MSRLRVLVSGFSLMQWGDDTFNRSLKTIPQLFDQGTESRDTAKNVNTGTVVPRTAVDLTRQGLRGWYPNFCAKLANRPSVVP